MEYRSVKNPKWANKEHTMIECTVDFVKIGVVPFGATPNDVEEHCREIFEKASKGLFGPVKEFSE